MFRFLTPNDTNAGWPERLTEFFHANGTFEIVQLFNTITGCFRTLIRLLRFVIVIFGHRFLFVTVLNGQAVVGRGICVNEFINCFECRRVVAVNIWLSVGFARLRRFRILCTTFSLHLKKISFVRVKIPFSNLKTWSTHSTAGICSFLIAATGRQFILRCPAQFTKIVRCLQLVHALRTNFISPWRVLLPENLQTNAYRQCFVNANVCV